MTPRQRAEKAAVQCGYVHAFSTPEAKITAIEREITEAVEEAKRETAARCAYIADNAWVGDVSEQGDAERADGLAVAEIIRREFGLEDK